MALSSCQTRFRLAGTYQRWDRYPVLNSFNYKFTPDNFFLTASSKGGTYFSYGIYRVYKRKIILNSVLSIDNLPILEILRKPYEEENSNNLQIVFKLTNMDYCKPN